MKTSSITRHLLAAASLAIASLSSTASVKASSVIVNWGGSYVPADRSTGATATKITGGSRYNYSLTEKKNPANSDYIGTSAIFYGAVQTSTETGNLGNGQMRVNMNDGIKNRIHIQSENGSITNPANAQGFLFWQKKDFLAGFSEQDTIKLSDLSELHVNVPLARGNTVIRFAVMSDNVWYLSEASLSGNRAGTTLGEFNLSGPAGINWGVWTVQGAPGDMLDAAPTVFDISGDTLNNITAIGFYFNATYTASNAAILDFDEFSVTAVPEASHVVLLSLSSLLFVGNFCFKGFTLKK